MDFFDDDLIDDHILGALMLHEQMEDLTDVIREKEFHRVAMKELKKLRADFAKCRVYLEIVN